VSEPTPKLTVAVPKGLLWLLLGWLYGLTLATAITLAAVNVDAARYVGAGAMVETWALVLLTCLRTT
jgi:hypothetical protein